ncbi:hypothetical protein G6F57_019908 [Rhizopus arrhizus]|nr:hypothetical protein G6F31_019461 [Rhizopus arrhizus]KAG1438309.1 hypothetical protein G6F57_019908 [Rhizopus arrhizus]
MWLNVIDVARRHRPFIRRTSSAKRMARKKRIPRLAPSTAVPSLGRASTVPVPLSAYLHLCRPMRIAVAPTVDEGRAARVQTRSRSCFRHKGCPVGITARATPRSSGDVSAIRSRLRVQQQPRAAMQKSPGD